MKKTVLWVFVLLLFAVSCAPKLIPPQDQHRMMRVDKSVNDVYRAVKPSLLKNGYAITERDITTGVVKARKINGEKMLIISVKRHPDGGTFVKMRLIVKKNGRPLRVPEKTMLELEKILQDMKAISSG